MALQKARAATAARGDSKATSPEALVDYADAVFDHYQQRPHLARLLHWEGLERGHEPGADETRRADRYRAKMAVVKQCLPETAIA